MRLRFFVIGAAVLALIATKYPAIQRSSTLAHLFDCLARYATRSVDGHRLDDSARRASIHTSAALATPHALRGCVILVMVNPGKENWPISEGNSLR